MDIIEIVKPFLERISIFIVPGLIYGIGAIGLSLSLRFLKFPDFTVLGSIIVGGIVCINAVNSYGSSLLGIVLGGLSGGLFGLITGLLSKKMGIPKVLSSIISYTASFTLSYGLSRSGEIALPVEQVIFIHGQFSFGDMFYIILISISICLILAFIIQTKFGSLVLAMIADGDYLKYRHRYQTIIFICVVTIGNILVGLSGALYALRERSASVHTHYDFLPIALGAIYGGNAITLFFSKRLHKNRVDTASFENGDQVSVATSNDSKTPAGFLNTISSIFTVERLDSKKVGWLFFTYVLGCLFLVTIKGIVQIYIEFNFSFLVVSILIALFVWWAAIGERDK